MEFFIGGMVIDPNGTILRLDISDGFAEITQNGTMNRNMILKDWLGTPRVTLDGAGAVVQAADYFPYGKTMDLRSYTAGVEADRYRFTGHEHYVESGYDYHGARYYQPEVGRYLGVDVMGNSRAWVSSYNYVQDNPVNRVDLTGMLDGDYYSASGRHLGNDGIDDDKAYLVEGEGKFMLRNFQAGGKFYQNPSGFSMLGDGYEVTDIGMSNSELNMRSFLTVIMDHESHDLLRHGSYFQWIGFFPFTRDQASKGHPGLSPKGKQAAGAYMTQLDTWNSPENSKRRSRFGITDFLPEQQDKFAILTIKEVRHAYEEVIGGDFSSAIDKVNLEWRVLPGTKQQGGAVGKEVFLNEIQSIRRLELQGSSKVATPQGQLLKFLDQ
ncbi:MAG TPA: RHS repeat-associated core domain-containing protein [Bacteroidia bacterium]|nr:RHS repeat-associated core domain-containing protein [Bacteroidia bacterium]